MYAFVYQCNLSVYVSCFIVYIKILFKWCAQTNPWLQYWLAFDNSSNFLRVPMELMEFNKYCTNIKRYIYYTEQTLRKCLKKNHLFEH